MKEIPREISEATTKRRTKAATAGLAIPALMALGMSADTSYRFLGTTLQITQQWERAFLTGTAEAAIVALTVYAWATRTKGPAYLAYAAVAIQAVPAFGVSGGIGGPVRVALGPVVLAVMLHLLLGLEVRMSGARPDSLLRTAVREARERLTARLGIGRRGADSAAIARSRAADHAVALADLVAAAKPGTRRYRRRAARLAAAIDATRHGLDTADAAAAETVVVGRIVRRKSVGDLAAIEQRHQWTTVPEVASDGLVPAAVPDVPAAYPQALTAVPGPVNGTAIKPRPVPEFRPITWPLAKAYGYALGAGQTRSEVTAQWTPGYAVPGSVNGVPEDGEDELLDRARGDFADVLGDGRTPSIRRLRDAYSIGQQRAQNIQRALEESR
jgi:hypothetical protein